MDQFKRCQQQLKHLINEKILPINMQRKLKYIQSLVLNKHSQAAFVDLLPDFQRSSLDQMNRDTQKAFFINIVNCFTSKQIQQFKDIKVSLKKKQQFNSKLNLYLSCIGNTLTVANKKDRNDVQQQFQIEKIQQLANKQHKIINIGYEGKQFQIIFQDKNTCDKIHSIIQKSYQQSNQKNNAQKSQIIENIKQEQIEHLKTLKKNIAKYLINQDKFKLFRNISNGKIEVNQTDNSVRMLLFVEHCKIDDYIESYLMLDCWNTQVETFKILKQIRKNAYLAYIKLKKYNLWTTERYAYVLISFLKQCKCIADEKEVQSSQNGGSKYYLLFKSVQYDQQATHEGVKMDFTQIASFSQMEDMDNKIFVSLVSNIDYKAYDFLIKKSEININILKDVSSIAILYKQRVIQKNNIKYLDFDRCGCTIQEQYSIIHPSLQEEKRSSIDEQAVQVKQPQPTYQTNQTIQIIKDSVSDIKNQKIIKIIKKKVYESYYLKQRFQLSANQKPFIESQHTLNANRTFLINNGKWQISKDDEYVFIDENELKIQKGVLKLIIKQITSNILAGKSIMTMSLPVQIFDRISTLEGVVDILGFVPKYMHDATKTKDIVQQIKNVAAAFIFMFACCPKVCKPFNPILGETFQAFIGGIPIFVEQISHHPPISAFYMKNDKFQAYGNFDLHVDLGLNAAYSKIYGVYHVKIFETNTQFVMKYPDVEMGGVMFGERILKPKGKGYILQKKNNIYLEYSIGKDKKKVYEYETKVKSSDLVGGIFKVNKQFSTKLLNEDKKKATQGIKFEDIVQKYSQISGKWYGNLYFDKVQYKSIQKGPFPILLQRPNILLPSDTLFREDIIYKKWGDNKRSNQEKQRLQNLQRRDRKLRDKSLK